MSDVKTAADAAPLTADDGHTPIIYFEAAPNFRNIAGIVSVTLATFRNRTDGKGGIDSQLIAVADLKCSIEAAHHLRNALDRALLLGMPTEGKAN